MARFFTYDRLKCFILCCTNFGSLDKRDHKWIRLIIFCSQISSRQYGCVKTIDSLTPRSKTVSEMRQEGISPARAPKLKKKLLLQNALIQGIKETKNQKLGKKLISLRKIISGRVLKKYRCARFFSAQTGIERRSLGFTSKKPRPQAAGVSQATTENDELRKLVIIFLKRGDNSHQLPGKRDSIKVKENTTLESQKRRIQKYILSDYLSNLFLKFQAEYADEKSIIFYNL